MAKLPGKAVKVLVFGSETGTGDDAAFQAAHALDSWARENSIAFERCDDPAHAFFLLEETGSAVILDAAAGIKAPVLLDGLDSLVCSQAKCSLHDFDAQWFLKLFEALHPGEKPVVKIVAVPLAAGSGEKILEKTRKLLLLAAGKNAPGKPKAPGERKK